MTHPEDSPYRVAVQRWLEKQSERRARQLPPGARCVMCGERAPIVLVPDHRRILCADHDAIRRGHSPMQRQHVARWRHAPWFVYVPANVHRRLTLRERFREARNEP